MYVSYPRLGQYGRLGNQLFQIAATYAHARDICLQPRFPRWPEAQFFPKLPAEWFVDGIELEAPDYDSPWNYEPIPKTALRLHGYFQSWRYFDKYREDLRSLFKLSIPRVKHQSVIHVRRGDYLALEEFHPVTSNLWYSRALKEFRSDAPIVVVSDDPQWCVNSFPSGRPLLVSAGHWTTDLNLLLGADTLVMANSSFSWWPAYLGYPAKVFYPKQWFGAALETHDVSQLVLRDWKGI